MMKSIKVSKFLVLFAMAIAAPAWGSISIQGFLKKNAAGDLEILVRESREPLRIRSTPENLAKLKTLRDGNYLVGSGEVLLQEKAVFFDSLHSVGLQELLGRWQSSRREIFEFKDFSNLNLYLKTSESDTNSISQTHSLNYVVLPQAERQFSIFITDNSRRMVGGTMTLHSHEITITIYDDKTRQVSEKISLSPVSTR